MWPPVPTCCITHRKRLNIQEAFPHHSWQSHWMLRWPIKHCVSIVICIITKYFTCSRSCKATLWSPFTMCHKVVSIFLYLLHVNSFILLPVYALETVSGKVPICQITFSLEIIFIHTIRSSEHNQRSGRLNETSSHVCECRMRLREAVRQTSQPLKCLVLVF